MLEYTKTILQKVSFNSALVRKELAKSLKWLSPQERTELEKWIKAKYGSDYDEIFMEVAQKVIA